MKEIDPACSRLMAIAQDEQSEIMAGKTILQLKAVCAIYQNMVNKVASGSDEGLDINWIKQKIHE